MSYILLFLLIAAVVGVIGACLEAFFVWAGEVIGMWFCLCIPVYIIAALIQSTLLPDVNGWIWFLMIIPAIVIHVIIKK